MSEHSAAVITQQVHLKARSGAVLRKPSAIHRISFIGTDAFLLVTVERNDPKDVRHLELWNWNTDQRINAQRRSRPIGQAESVAGLHAFIEQTGQLCLYKYPDGTYVSMHLPLHRDACTAISFSKDGNKSSLVVAVNHGLVHREKFLNS